MADDPQGSFGRMQLPQERFVEPTDLPTAPVPVVKPRRGSGARIHEARPAQRAPSRSDSAGEKRRYRARYAIVYDVAGPRVLLGVGWAILVAISLVYPPGRPGVPAALFAAAAAWAAYQTRMAWRAQRPEGNQWVAAAGAGALPLAAAFLGSQGLGVALLAFVALALVAELIDGGRTRATVAVAGHVVTCGVWVGLASASVVLTLRYEIGAVITLLVLVAVYEASDYIVGSGASNLIEGPLAGIISIAVVIAIVAFLRVPPFRGVDALAFGGLAAIGCPLGQLVGSALLPIPAAPAPALRRLDSLLVLAPVWAWQVGLLLTRTI